MQASTNRLTGSAGLGDNVFLTGATGFLGGQILRRILANHPETRISVLVRATPSETAQERVDRLLASALGQTEGHKARDRVEVVEGNVIPRDLALTPQTLRRLQARVDHVIHCAATIRFDLPLDVARRDNTEGTRHVLDFSERLPHLRRLDYVGTAYVAGRRRGLIKEDELDVGQPFWNSYERTKMEAEKLVRAFGVHRPAAIYRPSIIVGDSRTGETSAFQGLYQVLPLYMRRLILAIPADPHTRVDLVPIDYVLDALFALMGTPASVGRCFHLTSGPGNTCTVDELVRILSDFTKIKPPPYVSYESYRRIVKPLFRTFLWGKKRAAMLRGEYYLPYLSSELDFDKTTTDECLSGSGIKVPHASSYFRKLVAFQARTLRGEVRRPLAQPQDEGAAVETSPARSGATP
jgi:thioester reductase-like protein